MAFVRMPSGAFVLVLSALAVSGCSGAGITTPMSCIDWVYFDTPADAVADADAVIIGRIESQAGTTTYYDLHASTWDVSVETWIKGSETSAELVVTSLPRSCGDTGDTLANAAGSGPVVLFLRDGDAGWETLTPFQGLVAAGPDGEIPAEWPDDLYE